MFSRKTARAFACAAIALIPAAAYADHSGPTGGPSSGGGINTVSAATLDEGHWTAGIRFAFAKPDILSDGELIAREQADIDAHSGRGVVNASVGLAYGITHDLTVSVELPYVSRRDIRASDNRQIINRGFSAGLGDLTLLAKFRPVHSQGWELAVLSGVKVPTGPTARVDRNGDRFETEHQPGSGSWDPIVGFAASHTSGANRIAASLLYQFAAQGAQSTRLGNRAQAGLSLSHRFGSTEHGFQHHNHEPEEHHEGWNSHNSIDAVVELLGEGDGGEDVAGIIHEFTGGHSLWVAPGARFNFVSGWSVAGSFGVPVYQRIRASHPDNRYRLSVSVGRSF